jgi:hypothetical protein
MIVISEQNGGNKEEEGTVAFIYWVNKQTNKLEV